MVTRKEIKRKTARKPAAKKQPVVEEPQAVEQAVEPVEEVKPRKAGRPWTFANKPQLEEEQLRLKNEKLKLLLSDWRRERDRQIAVAIVESLKAAMAGLKDAVKKGMKLNAAIDKMLKALSTVDYDVVLADVEQGEDEEDE